MSLEKVLFSKNGFCFSCIKKNHYKLDFSIENKNIILPNIINFDLIKLIYDLNPDIYEKVNIEKINENEAVVSLLMKHFFEDMGMPQRFSFVRIIKTVESNVITFTAQSIKTHRPEGMPTDSELATIQNITNVCNIISPHHIQFSCNLLFDNTMVIPAFAEKFLSVILFNIFKRVKQFIDNIII